MSTARAILSFNDMHENNQNTGNHESDNESGNDQDGNAPKEPEERPTSPQIRMQLRSRKRKHTGSS